jgi:hypothetical protein
VSDVPGSFGLTGVDRRPPREALMSTPTNPANHDADERTDPAAVHGDSPEEVELNGESPADEAAVEGAVDQVDGLLGGPGRVA